MTTPPGPLAQAVGSASARVHDQLAGARRAATVLHAGADAVYLELEGRCVAVLGARAVHVPCGVRTLLPRLPPARVGDAAAVQDGVVHLPGAEVHLTTVVDPTVPDLTADLTHDRAADLVARGAVALDAHLGGRLDAVRGALPSAALTRLGDADPGAVIALIGLGPGLTPLGDDVVAGWLATAVATAHPGLDDLRDAVRMVAPTSTTILSATLLDCAARGEAVPPFRALLAALAEDDHDALARALGLVLGIGDTSGAGLVLGARLALDRPGRPRRPSPSCPDPEGAAA